ncbi:MAG: tetratricopeptide repeat protein [Candidatus Latescibacteria bacterium]|nr:tetratricopeptide repeat protein [Candidatus Latescibacterota bacterium]
MSKFIYRRAPYLIVGLALLVRLVYLLQIDASPLFAFPVVDARTYTEQAQRLAAGQWLGRGEGPFWQPPLYPYLLGLVKVLAPESFFYAARLLQMILGTATCLLTYRLGSHLFSPTIGLAAGLAGALYGPLLFFDGELLPATLGTFLILAGLNLLWRALQGNAPGRFLSAGLVLGLAALALPTVLPFAGAAVLYIAWTQHQRSSAWPAALKSAAAFLLGLTLAIAPVTWRNGAIGGDAALISTNAGVNFYLGNNPHYPQTLAVRPGWEWDEIVHMPDRAGLTQASLKSRYFFALSWDYITTQPLHYLGLLARKTWELGHGQESGRNQAIYYWRNYSSVLAGTLWKWGLAFPFGLVAPLALLGLLLQVRRRGPGLPILFVLCYSLTLIAFFPTARYRLPLLPLLLLLAAVAVAWLYQQWREDAWRPLALGLAVTALFAVAANFRTGPMDMQGDAEIHYNLGNAHAKARQVEPALQSFRRAVTLDSTYWQAWLNLGSLEGSRGNLQQAIVIFTRVARAQPHRVEVWLNLAHAHIRAQQPNGALGAYQQALKADPRRREIYIELIALYIRAGSFAKAEEVLKQAQRYRPQDSQLFQQFYRDSRRRRLQGP